MAYSYDGEAGVLLVKPGTDEAPEKVVIEGVTSDASPILMPLEDGSVVVGGQQESGGGYLARINALGRDKLNAPQNLTAENRESLFQV